MFNKAVSAVLSLLLVIQPVMAWASGVLWLPGDQLDPFLDLPPEVRTDGHQEAAWLKEHGAEIAIPGEDGNYLMYSIERTSSLLVVFFGPMSKCPDTKQYAARFQQLSGNNRLARVQAVCSAEELRAMQEKGIRIFLRTQALFAACAPETPGTSEISCGTAAGFISSPIEQQQQQAEVLADLSDAPIAGIPGYTLGEAETSATYATIGKTLLTDHLGKQQLADLTREPIKQSAGIAIVAVLNAAVREGRLPWLSKGGAGLSGFQEDLERAAATGNLKILETRLGRALVLASARDRYLSRPQLDRTTPSLPELNRLRLALQRELGAKASGDKQLKALDAAIGDPAKIGTDRKDLVLTLSDNLVALHDKKLTEPSDQDVTEGRELLTSQVGKDDKTAINADELDAMMKNGAGPKQSQRLVDAVARRIGLMETVDAVADSTQSVAPTQLSKDEVRRIVGATSDKKGDTDDGDSKGSSPGGDENGSSKGGLPLKSIPVLQMIARLVAQAFNVEPLAKQLAVVMYLLAPDVIEGLVNSLDKLDSQFPKGLRKTAGDVNQLMDTLGPLMDTVGALMQTAVDKGMDAAIDEFVKLAEKKLSDKAKDELKKQIAKATGLNPALINIDDLMGLPKNFDLGKLQTIAEDAAHKAIKEELKKKGLDPDQLKNIDFNNLDMDALKKEVVTALKKKGSEAVVKSLLGERASVTDVNAFLTDTKKMRDNIAKGDWNAVGTEVVTRGRDSAYQDLSGRTGLTREALSNPGGDAFKKETRGMVDRSVGELLMPYRDAAATIEDELARAQQDPGAALKEAVLKHADTIDGRLGEDVREVIAKGPDAFVADRVARESARIAKDVDAAKDLLVAASRMGNMTAEEASAAVRSLVARKLGADSEALERRIAAGEDPKQLLREYALAWGDDQVGLRLGQEGSRCVKATLASPELAKACREWLDFDKNPGAGTVKSQFKNISPAILGLVAQGDREALVSALLQKAMDIPPDLAMAVQYVADGQPLDAAIGAAAGEIVKDARADAETVLGQEHVAQVIGALRNGDIEAAATLFKQYITEEDIQAWDAVHDMLALQDKAAVIAAFKDLVARQRNQFLDKVGNDERWKGLKAASQCAETGSGCDEAASAVVRAGTQEALKNLDPALAEVVLNGKTEWAGTLMRGEFDRAVSEVADPGGTHAPACVGKQGVECLLEKGVLEPAVESALPNVGAKAAQALSRGNAKDVATMQRLAESLSSCEGDANCAKLPEGVDKKAVKEWAAKDNALSSPDLVKSGRERLFGLLLDVSPGMKQVLETNPDARTLLADRAEASGVHLVQVAVQAYIPSAQPAAHIYRLPSKPEIWVVPGPRASIGDWPPGPFAKSALGDLSADRYAACFEADTRTVGSPASESPSGQAWVLFDALIDRSSTMTLPPESRASDGGTAPRAVDCGNGSEIPLKVPTETPQRSVAIEPAAERSGNVIKVSLEGPQPLAPIESILGLQGELSFDGKAFSWVSTHRTFPAYEAYVRIHRKGCAWVALQQSAPADGSMAFNVLGVSSLSDSTTYVSPAISADALLAACPPPAS